MSRPQPQGHRHQDSRLTEALGNAVRLIATGGQAGDCPQTQPLLEGLQPGKVLADTAYDSDENRTYCA